MNIKEVLKKYWGYDGFLPLQREAMECVMAGRDSIVVLPTGGGKSLCFQAPAMIMTGLAVVVSPLISLMKDQVDALKDCGIAAARLDSTMSSAEQEDVFTRIRNRTLNLLYLAPERLVSNGFIRFLSDVDLSFIAVDEAHCVSMWGHDFRPEYGKLGLMKKVFKDIPVHTYTATATKQVRDDIAVQLGLKDPEVLIGHYYRSNLVYKTERRANLMKQVCTVLDRHKGESGIIYCIRRVDVEEMFRALTGKGYSILPYHAGMDDEERKINQEAFIREKVDAIAATVAFGMGIDKSNVRYVIHAGMPKSLEHYQQESGRAGRDGLEAECLLFYSGGDYGIWKRILRDSTPEAKEIAASKLNAMYNYCTGIVCRHRAILNYFGQDLDTDNCAACDVCLGDVDCLEDSLETSRKILSCVVRLKEGFGAEYTASVLTGSKEQRILENGHNTLSTYNLLSGFTKRVVRDWIEQLIAQGCIAKSEEYSVLTITKKGLNVLREEDTPQLLKPVEKKPAALPKFDGKSWEGVDRQLFEVLRRLRRKIADEKGFPAYIVFGDVALRDMARKKPVTDNEFLDINGAGEIKLDLYGAEFISAIKEYCR